MQRKYYKNEKIKSKEIYKDEKNINYDTTSKFSRLNIRVIKLHDTYWGYWDWGELSYLNYLGQSETQ